jgi:YesN/AraC family two-component response regulator
MASQLEPDIVVVDLPMPVLNGLDATRLARDARPATQVVC